MLRIHFILLIMFCVLLFFAGFKLQTKNQTIAVVCYAAAAALSVVLLIGAMGWAEG